MSVLSNGPSQFYALLSQLSKDNQVDAEWAQMVSKRLAFVPSSSLRFPTQEVSSVTEDEHIMTVTLCFMGFLGVDSPLPGYFNQLAEKEDRRGNALKAMLQGLSSRHYILLYLTWQHYVKELPSRLDNLSPKIFSRILSRSEYLKQMTRAVSFILFPKCNRSCIETDSWVAGAWLKVAHANILGRSFTLGGKGLLGEETYISRRRLCLFYHDGSGWQVDRSSLIKLKAYIKRLNGVLDGFLIGIEHEVILSAYVKLSPLRLGLSRLGKHSVGLCTQAGQVEVRVDEDRVSVSQPRICVIQS